MTTLFSTTTGRLSVHAKTSDLKSAETHQDHMGAIWSESDIAHDSSRSNFSHSLKRTVRLRAGWAIRGELDEPPVLPRPGSMVQRSWTLPFYVLSNLVGSSDSPLCSDQYWLLMNEDNSPRIYRLMAVRRSAQRQHSLERCRWSSSWRILLAPDPLGQFLHSRDLGRANLIRRTGCGE